MEIRPSFRMPEDDILAAGIGKKEIKSENPLIGRVLEMGGVVLMPVW